MDEQSPIPAYERSTETEKPRASRGISPEQGDARSGGTRPPHPATADPRKLKIVVQVGPAEAQPGAQPKLTAQVAVEAPVVSQPEPPEGGTPNVQPIAHDPIPARMLNEFVYCQRLFYYEFVEGVFVESADTLRGGAIHQRVDSGTGAMPSAKGRTGDSPVPAGDPPGGSAATKEKSEDKDKMSGETPAAVSPELSSGRGTSPRPSPQSGEGEAETIHSRSVQMGSERLGVVAKMDLVEVRAGRATPAAPSPLTPRPSDASDAPDGREESAGEQEDLFAALEVCPVDYKAGAPKEGEQTNELWDTDKMQLGLQALILRDNGYTCNEGIIYYRTTKQRVRLPITPELESWILQNIAEARRVITGPIPAPLVHSPKCVRCSLAPVCLPDETRMLAEIPHPASGHPLPSDGRGAGGEGQPRRLIAARDDTRPLYLNTPGYRVGCKDEVLTIKNNGPRGSGGRSGSDLIEEVRIRDVSHVALFGNIQISTQAIQSLCEQEVPVTYFSMGGWFYGITRGHALKNVFLRMEQFRLARDEATCLSLARQFVHGKIRNHRTLLMRNHLEPPEPIILKLKRASEDALAAGSLEELLGIEGAAAGQYFQQFSGMVKVEDDLPGLGLTCENTKQRTFNFNFASRNRRPPTDPVNAMLSLAYSLLSKDCTLAALAVGFDPYLGFYHQPRFGRPALGLDLMEEFRPLIAESTVLSCINNRVVTDKDFVRAGQAVNLTVSGRKRFFQTYEQRMSSLITHPLFDYKVSYRRALELQARLLAKALTGEIAEYIPLLTR